MGRLAADFERAFDQYWGPAHEGARTLRGRPPTAHPGCGLSV
jgi:hypothetical protein